MFILAIPVSASSASSNNTDALPGLGPANQTDAAGAAD